MHDRYILLAFIEVITGLAVCAILFFIIAPYGRHNRTGWGPVLRARFAWIIMESPAVFIPALFFLLYGNSKELIPLIFLVLWQIHYCYRTFLYPVLMRGAEKPFPVLLVLFALTFNSINGYLNGYVIGIQSGSYSQAWLYDIRFICGLSLFMLGLVTHIHSDTLLRRLRKPGQTSYVIPQGGLFIFVSAPNYLGEIVEWTGWALLTWSLGGAAFAVFTIGNLLPRACSNHAWYKKHFKDYPSNRKALVPGIL